MHPTVRMYSRVLVLSTFVSTVNIMNSILVQCLKVNYPLCQLFYTLFYTASLSLCLHCFSLSLFTLPLSLFYTASLSLFYTASLSLFYTASLSLFTLPLSLFYTASLSLFTLPLSLCFTLPLSPCFTLPLSPCFTLPLSPCRPTLFVPTLVSTPTPLRKN